MRDIKFRVWDTNNKEMLELEELNYEYGEPAIRTTMYNDYFGPSDMMLMQFTGLKDQNGKEIYEGDIVKALIGGIWYVGKIIYEHSEFTIDVTNNKQLAFGRMGIIEKLTEVVGNIYDNPELLEVENDNSKSR